VSLQVVISDTTERYDQEELMYHSLIFDAASGKYLYQAKIHAGVFPCQLKQDDKQIIIQPDGTVAIQANATLKRKELNTPTKGS
jgi:hypothetical protein